MTGSIGSSAGQGRTGPAAGLAGSPGPHAVTRRLALLIRAASGVPASSPWNSPNCHCRASSQSGSCKRASSPGAGLPLRLCGSSRVQPGGSSAITLIASGRGRTLSALVAVTALSFLDELQHRLALGGDRERHGTDLGQIERVLEHVHYGGRGPTLTVWCHRQQQRLRWTRQRRGGVES